MGDFACSSAWLPAPSATALDLSICPHTSCVDGENTLYHRYYSCPCLAATNVSQSIAGTEYVQHLPHADPEGNQCWWYRGIPPASRIPRPGRMGPVTTPNCLPALAIATDAYTNGSGPPPANWQGLASHMSLTASQCAGYHRLGRQSAAQLRLHWGATVSGLQTVLRSELEHIVAASALGYQGVIHSDAAYAVSGFHNDLTPDGSAHVAIIGTGGP